MSLTSLTFRFVYATIYVTKTNIKSIVSESTIQGTHLIDEWDAFTALKLTIKM